MNEFLIHGILQVSLLLLALLGGGIFPATVCLVAVLTFLAFGLNRWFSRPRAGTHGIFDTPPSTMRVSASFEILMAFALLFLLLTALPLPSLLDPLIGPVRASQNRAAATLLREAGRLGFLEDGTPWFCLSRNRAGTLRMFLLLGAVFGTALCVSSLSAKGKKSHLLFLIWAGAVIAAGGYVGQWIVPQGDTLWWTLPVPPTLPGPVGCFINRNHFAGFIAMLCPVTLALIYDYLQQRQWFSGLLMIGLAGVLVFSLFMTHSRGGILAFVAGSGLTAVWIVIRRHLAAGLLCVVALAAVTATLYLKTPSLQTRFRDLANSDPRSSVQTRLLEWRETLRTAKHYPVLGAGANGLRMVYPLHRQTSGKWLVHAENEYVQFLAEGGIAGLLLLGGMAVTAWRRVDRSALPESRTLRLAAIGALVTAAVHNAFDFPARQPLYAVTLGALAGLWLSPPPAGEPPGLLRWRLLPACVVMAGCALLAWLPLSTLQRLDSYSLLGESPPAELRRAIAWAPTSWNAWYMSGRAACEAGIAANRLDLCVFGETLMSHAAQCDPNNYRLWYDVGLTRRALRQHDAADQAFARAQELRPWLHPPPRKR